MIKRDIFMRGGLSYKISRAPKPPWTWRLRNAIRPYFWTGWLGYHLARGFSRLTGVSTLTSRLEAKVHKIDGTVINYGVLGYRSVTNAGVAFLVDDWDNDATDITTFNYHACGVGTTAENVADTGPETERNARASGTKSQPSANVLQTVATISNTGTFAITEHVIMSAVTAGTAWDRTVFAALNLVAADQVQFTYQLTVNAGG